MSRCRETRAVRRLGDYAILRPVAPSQSRKVIMTHLTQHKPLIAILGRPNVGKSTLFNRLVKRRRAIIENKPGITRDVIVAEGSLNGHDLLFMDTGGLASGRSSQLQNQISDHALRAVQNSDLVLFVMDGREGVMPSDEEHVQKLRRMGKPMIFVVNKIDQPSHDSLLSVFYGLGVTPLVAVSAEHQRNFSGLYEQVERLIKSQNHNFPQHAKNPILRACERESLRISSSQVPNLKNPPTHTLSIAITGRPNVGKSTLLNALLGDERVLVNSQPGTTRDPVDTFVSFKNRTYRFIDTAGIRRRAKTKERVEKVSIIQSLTVIDGADVVLLLMDGSEGPTEQDAHVAGYAHEKGKAIVLLANKWDEGRKKFTKKQFESFLELKMNYLRHCSLLYVSAKTKKNLNEIFTHIELIRSQFERRLKTSEINQAFGHIVRHHPLPLYNSQPVKMYYATQVKTRPPTFAIFCNYPKKIHFTYQRYLINALRDYFNFKHVPVRLVFRQRSS